VTEHLQDQIPAWMWALIAAVLLGLLGLAGALIAWFLKEMFRRMREDMARLQSGLDAALAKLQREMDRMHDELQREVNPLRESIAQVRSTSTGLYRELLKRMNPGEKPKLRGDDVKALEAVDPPED
jgi:predicted PurR-regulated permease PerM